MKKKLLNIFAISIFILFSVSNLIAQSYQLVWSDEFNYTGLPDSQKWSYDVGAGGWGNNELQYYTENRAENAYVEYGQLCITARHETYSGSDYTSARLVTTNKGDWLYGKIEVRAKLPSGTGTWPAIWMLPTDWEYGGWPNSGEIDIMEHVGYEPSKIYGTIHTADYNHTLGTQQGSNLTVNDCETEYHVYSIQWTPNKIEFYVDDTKWPFDKRFHLLLNIAIGGDWGGAQGVDDMIFPAKMYIDYVRVYQQVADINENSTVKKLNIFPQPADSNINITLDDNFDISDDCIVKIITIDGKILKSFKVRGKKNIQIDVSEFKTGVYSISVSNSKQSLSNTLIVK